MVNKFAQNRDIKLLIEEKQVTTAQFKRLIGLKGIFSLVRNADELSNEIYPIFLGSYDVKCIQEMMQSSKNYQKSSIITITPTGKDATLDNLIDSINDELQMYRTRKTKYKIEEVVKDIDGNLHVRMAYSQRMRGKNELLKVRNKVLNIKFEKRDELKKLLVDVRQNDNADLKEFEIFMKEINEIDPKLKLFDVEQITLDRLTKENQIKFFDDLIAYKHNDWKLDDIKWVDVKKYEVQDTDDDPDGEVTTDELAGINSAIFKGSSIRDTGIVKKFEEQGFYFISMKFKYSYIMTNDSFIIDINFKGSTEGIKIDIVKTYEMDENRELINVLSTSDQEKIIIGFQNISYKLYKNLVDSQKVIIG
ncbi:MAG TPA: hypothetical protein VIK86_06270 [Candidatus Paceibacterota bacterium]